MGTYSLKRDGVKISTTLDFGELERKPGTYTLDYWHSLGLGWSDFVVGLASAEIPAMFPNLVDIIDNTAEPDHVFMKCQYKGHRR